MPHNYYFLLTIYKYLYNVVRRFVSMITLILFSFFREIKLHSKIF